MIQLLADKYNKGIAYFFILLLLASYKPVSATSPKTRNSFSFGASRSNAHPGSQINNSIPKYKALTKEKIKAQYPDERKNVLTNSLEKEKRHIGGPNQPEMSSFKSAGVDNMVNLFTGDFSYNIPLMDVGGYPINIFYNGGITMEQEASWVGLGWNINPGTISRNMRGIPDDFDGSEELIQTQVMKPNKTWGARIGADAELIGIKAFEAFKGSAGGSIGISFNNYLGPAIDIGIKGGTNFSIGSKSAPEKNATPGVSAGLDVNLSSRYGLTFSPNVSLTASSHREEIKSTFGLGLSTSYNSRSGIKALQLSEQMTFSHIQETKDKKYSSQSMPLYSTSISFAKPSYVPSIRMPLTNSAQAGHFQFGGGIFGVYGSVETEVYLQSSEIAKDDITQKKPLIGFLYYQNAAKNPNAVMDFTRFNDGEVTPNTPIISVPQYTYDVFSIQGEGTGGSIRAYRNDLGYVRDNITSSRDKSWSAGVDVGPPGHYGGNFNIINTPSVISEWQNGNKLRNVIGFTAAQEGKENVYFRNPGETSVLNPNQYDNIGGADLVRFKLGGTSALPTITNATPTIEPVLERFNKGKELIQTLDVAKPVLDRKKRAQVTSFFTAKEAAEIGLDPGLKRYKTEPGPDNSYIPKLTPDNNLDYEEIPRSADYRKANHISQINVTETDGKRYIYGLPVYNTLQKDFTFTVDGKTDPDAETVGFSPNEASQESPHVASGSKKDGYVQITQTPPYAHSFLLTGLLSPDYVDVTGNGITEDDLGTAVKFNYAKYENHKWRTPLTPGHTANFNAGNRSEVRDDKGLISYGERETWYLHSLESKTLIALFTVENREDGKGALSDLSGINASDNSTKRLKKIDLYSKADLKKNGLSRAKPIKTVWFEYSYSLCQNTPDNTSSLSGSKGKLTLDGIYFTFNGKSRANKNKYAFSYANNSGSNNVENGNPDYEFNASDRWGTYKSKNENPEYTEGSVTKRMKNADYPYATQNKEHSAINAGAWGLKKVLLPSGGQIEVEYEGDDYAYVQNKRASVMMQVVGLGKDAQVKTDELYSPDGSGTPVDNEYVFVKVPEPCTTKSEVFQKYLQGINQLAFKLSVHMEKGEEFVKSYATIEDYGPYTQDNKIIWIKLHKEDGLSPLSLTALEYLREQLPGQAFEGYDVSETSGLRQVGEMLVGWLDGLSGAFKNPVDFLRSKNKAKKISLTKSVVRLNDPNGYKLGGGHRVKSVRLKDNWNAMANQYNSEYGQEYNYETTENFNGIERTISSGVASYEPSIGGEENPFQSIVQVSNKLPLGPTSYGAIEMPVLDAFFPAPVVGYSKVTVRSLKRGDIPAGMKSKSGIGKQVTEFYTAKDYPVYYSHTLFDDRSDIQKHENTTAAFFYKHGSDSRALSQGFLIAINDMHGKMKSQSSYAEGDEGSRIHYTEYFYRNTGSKGLDEKFDFVYGSKAGIIEQGNMGIDIELMTDTREFSVNTTSFEVQGQGDMFAIWSLFTAWPVSGNSENVYRAVTTTKVVNYHSIVDKIIVIDKGSQVTTENLVYDAETGNVLVSRVNNEFDKLVYNVNYPAYWAYSGMGLAYKNIDAVYSGVNFLDGKIVGGMTPDEEKAVFESGDEIYIMDPGSAAGCDPIMASPASTVIIWALNKNKNASSLTDVNPDFIFIDKIGKPYSRSGVKFRIVRSGKRNMLDASIAGVTMMEDPVIVTGNNRRLVANSDFSNSNKKVIRASSVEYKEKWQTDNDVFYRYRLVYPNTDGNLIVNGDFSQGNTGFTSQYIYHPTSYTISSPYYSIATTSSGWFPEAANCNQDHTSGSGNMMLVDGATDGRIVWSQTVPVKPNTPYLLSAWAMDIQNDDSGKPTQLRFKINGTPVGQIFGLGSVYDCSWNKFFSSWNSGNNTTAVIEITSTDLTEDGNDFALDDISFGAEQCALPKIEVHDCSGYLEKNINPYLKGLLGNFRAHMNRVFYGERHETDPIESTDIPKDGFLKNFRLYWSFNGNDNLRPDASGTGQWVWNAQSTLYNAKGLEVETKQAGTKDGLDIYTAAQYGYQKTIPTAIANNSRYEEMMYEGFEDYEYSETLNGAIYNDCAKKHIDFTGVANSQVTSTDNSGILAHSGKHMLSVATGKIAVKPISIKSNADEPFSIDYQSKTISHLNELGGDFSILSESPITFTKYNSFSNFGSNVQTSFYTPSGGSPVSYNYKTKQYFEVQNGGTYSFFTSSRRISDVTAFGRGTLTWSITSVETGASVPSTIVWSSSALTFFQTRSQVCLPKGVYLLECTYGGAQYNSCPNCGSVYTSDTYDIYIENNVNNITSYKSISTQSVCTYTKPASASESMINPTFNIGPDKKMVFSAWVRESNTQVSTYNGNEVQIDFGSGHANNVIIKPTGPIIDGWQRYEGYFTAPTDVSSMNLKLVNTSGATIYFDDIRIYPFNANMKSYVYDPVSLRLTAELDANNYATFYEYDEEGTLVRTKVETKEGVKTINETRSFKQRAISTVQ